MPHRRTNRRLILWMVCTTLGIGWFLNSLYYAFNVKIFLTSLQLTVAGYAAVVSMGMLMRYAIQSMPHISRLDLDNVWRAFITLGLITCMLWFWMPVFWYVASPSPVNALLFAANWLGIVLFGSVFVLMHKEEQ